MAVKLDKLEMDMLATIFPAPSRRATGCLQHS